MYKKLLIVVSFSALIFTSIMSIQVNAAGADVNFIEYDDLPSPWAKNYILNIKNSSDINVDRLLNHYRENITRSDFAFLGVKLYEYYTGHEIMTGERFFKDTRDEWVLKAKKAGIVSGYSDKTYKPNDFIRRDEIAELLIKIFKAADVNYKNASTELFSDDFEIAGWAKESVYIAKANNVMGGIGNNIFDPAGYVTREQSLIMLYKATTEIQRDLTVPIRLGIDKIILREVESSIQNGRRVDKIEYPYELDSAVLGQWVSVDFVNNPLTFDPKSKHYSPLYIDSVIFYEGGTFIFRTYYEGDSRTKGPDLRSFSHTWTNEFVILSNDMTTSRYFIATVNDEEYLFFEFKNGDYVYRNATPNYYVFKRNESL